MTDYHWGAKEPEPTVYCSDCGNWCTNDDIVFLDVQESPQGYDEISFTCKRCGSHQTSFVRSG